mgnify:CR=1 FL=1
MSTADSRAYSLTLLSLLMPAEHLAVFRYLLEILADTAQLSKVCYLGRGKSLTSLIENG